MDQANIQERIKNTIYKKDPKAVAFLFGSRARGDNRMDSDWDILILVDAKYVSNAIEDKFRDGLFDIELETGQIISSFIYPKDYWKNTLVHSPFYKNITNEGIKL